ncbi:MAG: acetoin dehydrogenase [Lentisphaerae bacterium GWF2_45_14]|nr:MAG: acetoin dehydrogenase [Lentisphaerae bacterium GWF2_45_14]
MIIKKAAVLFETKKSLKIVENIICPTLASGQLFVEIAFSGVCRSQLMEAQGLRGEDKYLPHMLGHEGTGTVLETGPGVTKFKRGDKVVLGWIKGSGIDAGGVKYQKDGIQINAGPVTTFSTHAIVSENRCCLLPEGIPMDVAVLLGCAVPTGAGIIINQINPASGKSIALFGLGGIGISALMATKLYDFKKVIAVDVEQRKLDLALELSATDIINSSTEEPVKKILELTDGKGTDYSVDASGQALVTEQAFGSVRTGGGLCIFASHPDSRERICLDPLDFHKGRNIMGSWGGTSILDRDIPRFAKLYLEGRLPLEKLLDARYSLENINQALYDLDAHRITRALIEINKDIA